MSDYKAMSDYKTVRILLVEDNEGDVFLTRKAFEKAKIANDIMVAKDGEVAMDMLNRVKGYEETPTPDLVLLDMNLPKKDGRQVLREIKESEKLRRIPVVILTSSKAEQDVLESYNLFASSYIVKPIDFQKFHDIVAALENFWFTVVVLPTAA